MKRDGPNRILFPVKLVFFCIIPFIVKKLNHIAIKQKKITFVREKKIVDKMVDSAANLKKNRA